MLRCIDTVSCARNVTNECCYIELCPIMCVLLCVSVSSAGVVTDTSHEDALTIKMLTSDLAKLASMKGDFVRRISGLGLDLSVEKENNKALKKSLDSKVK